MILSDIIRQRSFPRYSGAILCYGQTGSGKTHTMFGPPGSLTEASLAASTAGAAPSTWGIFPRMALELLQNGGGTLHASAIEVYSNQAYDLLADRAPIKIGSGDRSKTAHKAGTTQKIFGNSGGTGYPGRDRWKQQEAEKLRREHYGP